MKNHITTVHLRRRVSSATRCGISHRKRFELVSALMLCLCVCSHLPRAKYPFSQGENGRFFIISFFSIKKNKAVRLDCLVFYGGEREIRTLGTVLAFTRFPVVRLRPTQPSLHDLSIIAHSISKIKRFLKVFLFFLDFFVFPQISALDIRFFIAVRSLSIFIVSLTILTFVSP